MQCSQSSAASRLLLHVLRSARVAISCACIDVRDILSFKTHWLCLGMSLKYGVFQSFVPSLWEFCAPIRSFCHSFAARAKSAEYDIECRSLTTKESRIWLCPSGFRINSIFQFHPNFLLLQIFQRLLWRRRVYTAVVQSIGVICE